MQQSSILSLGLLLFGTGGLVSSKVLPNPQPDPMITSPPGLLKRSINLNEGPLIKRQLQSPEEVCGAGYLMCDVSHCCPRDHYCVPEFDSTFTNYVWKCNDLSGLGLDYSDWESSLSDILASYTEDLFGDSDIFPTGIFNNNDPGGVDSFDLTSGNGTSSGNRNQNNDDSGGGLGTGAIIGIVCGAVAIIAIIVFGIFFLKRQRQNAVPNSQVNGYPPPPTVMQQQPYHDPNPPNYLAVTQPPVGPGGVGVAGYFDPSKQPFLQNQQPNPQYENHPNQPPPHQQHYQPTPPHYQHPPPPQQQQYSYPEGIAEVASTETTLSPSVPTKKPGNNSTPITPIPSLVPTSGPGPAIRQPQQQQPSRGPQEFLYEMDSAAPRR